MMCALYTRRVTYFSITRMTELAYKYFFKTLNAQADRLMQSTEVMQKVSFSLCCEILTRFYLATKS